MNEKLKSLVKSRRFWTAIFGLLVVVANESLGMKLDNDSVQTVGLVLIAWILGDSLRKTEENQ